MRRPVGRSAAPVAVPDAAPDAAPFPAPPRMGAAWIAAVLLAGALAAAAQASAAEGARIRPGAIELGFSGALTAVEGSTRATLAVRGGGFLGASGGLAGFEAELGYHHQRALDAVELEGALSWQRALGAAGWYPFAAVGGGVRQEMLGSFRQARYPVGVALGLRALVGVHAAVRFEYRYRRVLNDPVADFTEHQALTGISLLLRNTGRPDQDAEKER